MGKSTINGHFQQLFVCLPEGISPINIPLTSLNPINMPREKKHEL
jgi:hypothetical protein